MITNTQSQGCATMRLKLVDLQWPLYCKSNTDCVSEKFL